MKENNINKHYIFWYLLIFSFLGLIIETLYCFSTTGVIESRKGLIFAPVCPIYGIGATVLIYFLYKYKNNIGKLFIYGSILGAVIEYFISFGLEAVLGTRFWEYSYIASNLNGRICITYSIFWGILSVFLINVIKPLLDKVIKKMPKNIRNFLELFLFIFILFDFLITSFGVSVYRNRAIDSYYNRPSRHYNNIFIERINDRFFTNERMKRIFPNLRFMNENNEEIFIRDILN